MDVAAFVNAHRKASMNTKKSVHLKPMAVIGDGSWGTTLAVYLAGQGYDVKLWGAFPETLAKIRMSRINAKFLPGIPIPDNVDISTDLAAAIAPSGLVILAVPSKYLGFVLKKIKRLPLEKKVFLSVTKGIETRSLLRMSQVIRRELGPVPLAVLSGPTIAGEVARGIPTTAVIASQNTKLAKTLQEIFNSSTFRVYTNPDVIGLELGGSLKNIIAIACGVCDGLGFGTNAKAAILSRGLVEISRLGVAMGAKKKTFAGLAGLGDLVTTCISPQSRNRYVGEQLGRGRRMSDILAQMQMVAEGVETVKAAVKLAKKYHVAMPISTEVHEIIYKGKKAGRAVSDLMNRKLKSE